MKLLGVDASDQDMVFRLLACVLHLGRVTFDPAGSDHCAVHDQSIVSQLAKLLETDTDALNKAFTIRVVAAKGEIYDTQLVQT
jgi:myosin heavy subunit